MNCPKCNHENAPDASICSACGSSLAQTPAESGRFDVKTSKLAVSSCYLAMVAVVFFLLGRFLPRLAQVRQLGG